MNLIRKNRWLGNSKGSLLNPPIGRALDLTLQMIYISIGYKVPIIRSNFKVGHCKSNLMPSTLRIAQNLFLLIFL